MKVKTYKAEISIKLDWIEDGFELTKEEIEEMLMKRLPWAYSNEFDIKVSKGRKREI